MMPQVLRSGQTRDKVTKFIRSDGPMFALFVCNFFAFSFQKRLDCFLVSYKMGNFFLSSIYLFLFCAKKN